jgi:hypothetical protein
LWEIGIGDAARGSERLRRFEVSTSRSGDVTQEFCVSTRIRP